jgi:SNF2 family DNA or RNA helicase
VLLTKLRPHQERAVAKARGHDGFALFPEQRTGKCLITFAIAEERQPNALLIVCPKGAINTWNSEIKKHWEPEWDCEVYIINYELITNNRDAWKKWAEKKSDLMMVVDEAHRIKKRGSKWSKTCRLIGKRAESRLALTGTPIAQGIQDAWAIFDFLNPLYFGKYKDFEESYLRVMTQTSRDRSWTKVIGHKNLDKFNEIYHKYSFRVTLNEAIREGGGKGIKVRRVPVYIDLEESRQLYQTLKKDFEFFCGGHFIETPETLTQLTKLHQICGGWVKVADNNDDKDWAKIGNEKLRELVKLVDQLRPRKLVICCRYLKEILEIASILMDLGLTVGQIRGGHPYSGEFKEDVIVIQIQAGVAIDLSPSQTIIFFSCDYSYIDFEQIRFRIRSYESKQITEYFLLMRKTVDEKIFRVQVYKEKLADLINEEFRREYERKSGVESTETEI